VAEGHVFASLLADGDHTCGVEKGTGKAWCWGENGYGQLGDGTSGVNGDSSANRIAPVMVTGGLVYSSMVTGPHHTCGLEKGTGKAYCWGWNGYGQLGDGTSGVNGDSSANRLVPVAVSGGRTFTALVAGYGHTCGLATGGTAYCWGWNGWGQLGDGTGGDFSANRSGPVMVTGGRVFSSLVTGSGHTCAVEIGTGKAWCWGANWAGQLGDGTSGDFMDRRSVPVTVTGEWVFSSLAAGSYYTCGVEIGTGRARCWGSNSSGQLGDGTIIDRNTPTAVSAGV